MNVELNNMRQWLQSKIAYHKQMADIAYGDDEHNYHYGCQVSFEEALDKLNELFYEGRDV